MEAPTPESPVWLPSLAVPRGSPGFMASVGHSTSGFTLPKARNLLTQPNKRSQPASLFSMATLPTLETLGMPGMRKAGSKVQRCSPSATCRPLIWAALPLLPSRRVQFPSCLFWRSIHPEQMHCAAWQPRQQARSRLSKRSSLAFSQMGLRTQVQSHSTVFTVFLYPLVLLSPGRWSALADIGGRQLRGLLGHAQCTEKAMQRRTGLQGCS